MDGRSLQALHELLNPDSQTEEDSNELDTATTPYATPAAIGPPPAANKEQGLQPTSGDIWNEGEVSEQVQYEYDDPRPQPEYEVVFQQSVGAEDVFLCMAGNTPATASCHHQLVRISLPDTKLLSDIELRITDTFLDCSTPNYRLGLHLPYKVQGDKSKAQWFADSHTLQVTLLLNREYEYLNH